ncbi:metal ABC transporter ATP-binding protein [Desulfovibrio sp. SGI.169]|uniref:metal ABC transporter ATP-binding protein n=1 Tax=Desulfovibrio sp. SGI.169 TaxID=3420561 RepID=UPI003CFC64CB
MGSADHASPAIVFERLRVRRGCNVILDDICATVPHGGNTVLVGPNGAGKTTLLLCLIGEIGYTGRILSKGGSGAPRPRLGYVPQQLQMDGGLPLLVSEFLSLERQRRPLWLGLKAAARARARHLLELVRVEHLENRRMGDLSGGELRRVLLAAALGREPELLVLDEPEAGVDFQGERLFWEVLDTARRAYGFTQLMVSHNLPLAAHYATHVICLNKSVRAQGPPRNTLTAANLLNTFGVPIHLYPDQCGGEDPACPQCGAWYGPDHPPSDQVSAPSSPGQQRNGLKPPPCRSCALRMPDAARPGDSPRSGKHD